MILKKAAAIDVGSNAVRLLISRINVQPDSSIKLKKELLLRVPLRLGEDTFSKGEISENLENRLIMVMKSFLNLIKVYQVDIYYAYTTAAIREAKNRDTILLHVKQKANVSLRIISGAEEAKLIYESHAADMLQADKNYLYVDVGGGSTEIALIINGTLTDAKSFGVGTIRMINEKGAIKEMEEMLLYLSTLKNNFYPAKIIGSGGNINKLYRLAKTVKKRILTIKKLQELYQKLAPLSMEERMFLYDLNPDRADVIVPACEIFLAVAGVTGITEIFVPNIRLVDGIVRSIIQEVKGNDQEKSIQIH